MNIKKTKASSRSAKSGLGRPEKPVKKEKVTRQSHNEVQTGLQDGNPEQTTALHQEQLISENSKRRQDDQGLFERLEFEQLVTDLSSHFVYLPSDKVDAEIERSLKRVYEFFGCDRCALLEGMQDKQIWKITHVAAVEYAPPVPAGTELPAAITPWVFEKLAKHEIIAFSNLDDLPAEANIDKQAFLEWGIRANLSIPIVVFESVTHIIVINATKNERVWPKELILRVQLLGEIFVNALERKQMELQLEESQTILLTLINSTTDLIWSVDKERFGLLTFNRGLAEYFLHGAGLHIKTGMNPDDLLPKEFAQKWYVLYRRVLEEGSFTADYQASAQGRLLRLNLNVLKRNDVVFGVSVFAQDITALKVMENQLRQQLAEISTLKLQLEKENVYLREEINQERGFGNIIGGSSALQYVLFRAGQVAPTDSTVLILGETGSGKGMVAHAIHEMSPRNAKAMVTINCAALPENLIESELFGREKGAFTGAHARQIGRFEVADGGTIFLDEIGEMPLALQAKLLGVLQDGQFERLGSTKTIKVDVRVIAATSRDLKLDVRNGRFREDLFYRLNVFPVSIPPLRIRSEDIPDLVHYFIDRYARKFGKQIETVSKSVMQILQNNQWPGNVRELEHVIERAVISSAGLTLQLADSLDQGNIDAPDEALKDLETIEREHILKVLQKTRWKIDGEGSASSILGLNPSTLRFRIKKLGITRP